MSARGMSVRQAAGGRQRLGRPRLAPPSRWRTAGLTALGGPLSPSHGGPHALRAELRPRGWAPRAQGSRGASPGARPNTPKNASLRCVAVQARGGTPRDRAVLYVRRARHGRAGFLQRAARARAGASPPPTQGAAPSSPGGCTFPHVGLAANTRRLAAPAPPQPRPSPTPAPPQPRLALFSHSSHTLLTLCSHSPPDSSPCSGARRSCTPTRSARPRASAARRAARPCLARRERSR